MEVGGAVFEELDKYITDFKCEKEFAIDDYWGDCGVVEVDRILAKFSDEDWRILLETITDKPIYWQKKLAYCLENSWNELELDILLKLLSTDDDELLEIVIDSLRGFVDELNDKPEQKLIVVQKIKSLLQQPNSVRTIVFENFISKLD